jgi:cell division septation protein DedD
MKRTDFKGKSSVYYIGKGTIILSLILTTSLGFMLGFFVGKGYRPAAENRQIAMPVQELKESSVQQKQETQTAGEIQKAPETKQAKEILQTSGSDKSGTQHEMKTAQQTQTAQEKQNTQNTPMHRKYSVQIGAFRNSADAKALKEKYDKKGYKTFVMITKTKKNDKLCKVLVGEYATKEEAELLSIKLKKLEGLKTFVTFKTH